MLASPKSQAYWYGMRVPIKEKQYSDTIRFAQGCLELIFYPVAYAELEYFDIRESWLDYRSDMSVLSDEFLNEWVHLSREADSEPDPDITAEDEERIFKVVGEQLDFHGAQAISDWARRFFCLENPSIVKVAERLLELLKADVDKVETTAIPAPDISLEDREFLLDSCYRIRWRNRSIDTHFGVASEVYKMTLPDGLEKILQDRYAEGARNHYWWMDSVPDTLSFVYFTEIWSKIEKRLGPSLTSDIIDWLIASYGEELEWPLKHDDFQVLRNL